MLCSIETLVCNTSAMKMFSVKFKSHKYKYFSVGPVEDDIFKMLKNFIIFLIFIQKRLQIFAYLSPENNYAGLILQESMIFYEMLLRLKSWSMTHGASLACSFYENFHSQHFGLYLSISVHFKL